MPARKSSPPPGAKSRGAKLFAGRLLNLRLTYAEAALQLRESGCAETVGRPSVCHWLQGRNSPSRRNAAAIQAWSLGTIPAPSWDEPVDGA